MVEPDLYKISFCTTCKGRLSHLQQTLPKNLAALQSYPNAEIVVLDYGSEDGLAAWLQQHYSAEIASGRIRYARYETPDFHMSHAKNMAHRLATGDILCNLDADNSIVPGFAEWLNRTFHADKNGFVNPDILDIHFGAKAGKPWDGLAGRIAMHRDNFLRLRGYDETISHWGRDATDIVIRAHKLGMSRHAIPQELYGEAIPHSNEARMENMSAQDQATSAQNLQRNDLDKITYVIGNILSSDPKRANGDGSFGCGTVRINGGAPTEIAPIPPRWTERVQYAQDAKLTV